jgi:hypothetical protein
VCLHPADVAHLSDLEEEFFGDGDGRPVHLFQTPFAEAAPTLLELAGTEGFKACHSF